MFSQRSRKVFTPTEVTGKLEKGRRLCLNPLSGDETRFPEKLQCSTGLGSQLWRENEVGSALSLISVMVGASSGEVMRVWHRGYDLVLLLTPAGTHQ